MEEKDEDQKDKKEMHCAKPLGDYDYDANNIVGHGAFAIVYKGWLRSVSIQWIFYILGH